MEMRFPSVAVLEEALRDIPEAALAGADLEAAVLLCLHGDHLLLVQRSEHEGDRWSGHVGLPGGRHEPGDESLLHTALRETREEVGFDVSAHGRVLGTAGTLLARGPGDSAVRIAIYVAGLHRRPAIRLSHELSDAFWVEVAQLEPTTASVPEKDELVPAFELETGGRTVVVWGITYRILERLASLEHDAGPSQP